MEDLSRQRMAEDVLPFKKSLKRGLSSLNSPQMITLMSDFKGSGIIRLYRFFEKYRPRAIRL
jgi:hypothetical protein